jgi:hypothetical protein
MTQQHFRLVRIISGIAGRALPIASLSALLCACSADVVNMGDDANESPVAPAPPAHSSCLESSTLSGDVLAQSQADIDALEGCETIDGNVLVMPYFEPDLRPLHALTAVTGELGLGASYIWSAGDPTREQQAAEAAALEGGFIASLEGLESLERVGSMAVWRASIPSLAPLANLRAISGALSLVECDRITDLTPLSGLVIRELAIALDNVESLAGLRLYQGVKSLAISGERLANIDALATVRTVEQDITIRATALRDLRGLGQLENVGRDMTIADNPALQTFEGAERLGYIQGLLVISGNVALERADGLNELINARGIVVDRNDRLRRLPDFPNLSFSGLYVWDNPALEELSRFPGILAAQLLPSGANVYDVVDGPRERLNRRSEIVIERNPSLQRFSVPLGWRDGTYMALEGNTQLSDLDFSELESIDRLEIKNNASLTRVSLGALTLVDSLEMVQNPLLPAAIFDAVRTFERSESENADSAP